MIELEQLSEHQRGLASVRPARDGQVARIGGPAGVALAGIPDAIDAYQEFRDGKTAEGLTSVAKGTVRVGFAAAGAALGTAFIPIPGVGSVVGAVVGGLVGDWVASRL